MVTQLQAQRDLGHLSFTVMSNSRSVGVATFYLGKLTLRSFLLIVAEPRSEQRDLESVGNGQRTSPIGPEESH